MKPRAMRRAWRQDHVRRSAQKKHHPTHRTDQEISMTSVSITKELPEILFSDILITAFDGMYGSSWSWFEPAPLVGESWLTTKHASENAHHDGRICVDDLWMSARVRLKEDYETGHALFDSREGFLIDHQSIAGGISRIVNEDYLGVWRPATPTEEDAIDNDTFSRTWRGVATEHGTGYEVSTGETASAYRSLLVGAVNDPEDADIDADVADAIVQVAAFGKVIFS